MPINTQPRLKLPVINERSIENSNDASSDGVLFLLTQHNMRHVVCLIKH